MENFSVLGVTEIKNKVTRFNLKDALLNHDLTGINPVMENILSEGGNDFYQYVSWVGLDKEPNLMVLSSMHHYYYDHDDLSGIGALVNIKKLNQIKHLESFLHTLYRIMPPKAYFAGCFKCSNHYGNRTYFHHSAKFLNGLISFFDSKNDRIISKRSAGHMLKEHGFKELDMTDINGLTYFWSQNIRRQGE
jgi:hypothetical protein